MRRQDFYYELPEKLIARFPLTKRSDSRLLFLPTDKPFEDRQFVDLTTLLKPSDLVIFNDSKVIPARVYGKKPTGGKLELLLERIIDHNSAVVKIKASKSPRTSSAIKLERKDGSDEIVHVVGRDNDLFSLEFESDALEFFVSHGQVPLPPYLERDVQHLDEERYQTVYAKDLGSVAAPTAGLHFDSNAFEALQNAGIEWDFVTLHVGSGTYQPVRVNDIAEHKMHAEYFEVSEPLVERIKQTRRRRGRIVAVGTTALRSLEAAASGAELSARRGDTNIFIYPGYRFKVVDALLTNFHLPESTLIMLVCALGGRERVLAAYHHAVRARYRFFSYGDCMLIENARHQTKSVS